MSNAHEAEGWILMSVISKWLVTDEQVHDIDAVYEFSCLRLVKSCWMPHAPPVCYLAGDIEKKKKEIQAP